ncbi:MAG: RimK family alpha-L-glutamate ligase [Deltaproteobacteria bacterium]|nr:RimK family alpha-L-glutamate ligase [Deltaproteobacteria bacterium]MBW2132781.1 RimK family alpha-L-glutamate ligase [Deltaproteobacteria bacterium]
MNIGIITVRDKDYPPNFRLMQAAREQKHRATLIHPYRVWPAFRKEEMILVGEAVLPPDIILPRQGATLGDACLSLICHFRLMGIPVVNGMEAIRKAKDKFLCLQLLKDQGIPVPDTILVNAVEGLSLAAFELGGFPVVIKPVSSRQGEGVTLVKTGAQLQEAGKGLDPRSGLLVQQFIPPEGRKDLRVVVIGEKVAGVAEFTPVPGDFRGNFHLSQKSRAVTLNPEILDLAITSAKRLGLEIAGVDLLVDAQKRPFVMEVNYSPGFRGLEAATGHDIAGEMVRYLRQRYETAGKRNHSKTHAP